MNPTQLAIVNISLGFILGMFIMWQIMVRKLDKIKNNLNK